MLHFSHMDSNPSSWFESTSDFVSGRIFERVEILGESCECPTRGVMSRPDHSTNHCPQRVLEHEIASHGCFTDNYVTHARNEKIARLLTNSRWWCFHPRTVRIVQGINSIYILPYPSMGGAHGRVATMAWFHYIFIQQRMIGCDGTSRQPRPFFLFHCEITVDFLERLIVHVLLSKSQCETLHLEWQHDLSSASIRRPIQVWSSKCDLVRGKYQSVQLWRTESFVSVTACHQRQNGSHFVHFLPLILNLKIKSWSCHCRYHFCCWSFQLCLASLSLGKSTDAAFVAC